jgi:hypothetical protein
MVPTIGHLQRLAAAGVSFHSYTEPMLSTDNEMIRDIVLAVMASLAKQERLRHLDPVRADPLGNPQGARPRRVRLDMRIDLPRMWFEVPVDEVASVLCSGARKAGCSRLGRHALTTLHPIKTL